MRVRALLHVIAVAALVASRASALASRTLNDSLPLAIQQALSNSSGGDTWDNVYAWEYSANEFLQMLQSEAATNVAAAATQTVVALDRKCAPGGVNASAASRSLFKATATLISTLASMGTWIDQATALLASPQAQFKRDVRTNLEYASSSLQLVEGRCEKLLDVANAIATPSSTNQTEVLCAQLFTASVQRAEQYELQTAQPESYLFRVIVASVGGALGLVLLLLPPVQMNGSRASLCLAMMYAWGLVGFTIAWYCFDMNSASTWVTSAWWRDLYAVFGIGLLAAVVSLFPSILASDLTGPLVALHAGLGVGVVIGAQVNTMGLWLAQTSWMPVYFTLVVAMGAFALLLAMVLVVWTAARPGTLAPLHFASCVIGGWLLIQMVGVLVGDWPVVFDMSPPYDWTATVYVVSMWVLSSLAFALHVVVYHVAQEWKAPTRKAKDDPPIKPSHVASSASGEPALRRRRPDDDETRPLLESGEPEFGGIRAATFGPGSERYSSKR